MSNQEFILCLEGFDKLELIEIENAIKEAPMELRVSDNKDRYGEPVLILGLYALGAVALPAVLVYLGLKKNSDVETESEILELPDGTKYKRVWKKKQSSSEAPSPETLKELSKFSANINKLADGINKIKNDSTTE